MIDYKELTYKSMRVLVADDTPMMRMFHQKNMLAMGFDDKNLIFAQDGSEAIKALALSFQERRKVDFIVCDWDMPKISGLEFLLKVRTVELTKSIPFLMVTGHSSKEDIVKVVQSGCNGYIVKPFKEDLFAEKVRDIVSKLYVQP